MRYTWDPAKATINLAKHGVDLQTVDGLTWEAALVASDVRHSYPEPRLVALAPIEGRLHVLVFSIERRAVRVISLRKANNREAARYDTQI